MSAPTSRPESPSSPWVLKMKWHDVLFLHWPVDPDRLRDHIPPCLDVETHGGSAWLGLVPFRMSGVRPRWVPPLSFLSRFPEMNLRTYVHDGSRPGVWFFSLDASRYLAVKAARWIYALDYYHADVEVRRSEGTIHYRSRRREYESGSMIYEGRYRPTSPLGDERDELIDFLTERYVLFSARDDDRVYRAPVDHDPWELYHVEQEIRTLTVRGHPQPPDDPPASALYSPFQSVKAWLPERIKRVDGGTEQRRGGTA